jgi:hypothetical protein
MPSSPTTIVTKRVQRWRRSSCYMDVDAEICCFGMGLENERFLDPTYCKKSRIKFIRLGRTFELCSPDKRGTPIIGGEN